MKGDEEKTWAQERRSRREGEKRTPQAVQTQSLDGPRLV